MQGFLVGFAFVRQFVIFNILLPMQQPWGSRFMALKDCNYKRPIMDVCDLLKEVTKDSSVELTEREQAKEHIQ